MGNISALYKVQRNAVIKLGLASNHRLGTGW